MTGRTGPPGPGDEAHPGSTAEAASDDDDELLDELRTAVARFDPMPALLSTLPHTLLSWRNPDAELADLVADSRELAGAVRSGNEEVLLRFEAAPYAVTVEVSPDGQGQYRLLGQVEPGGPGAVHLHQVDASTANPPVSVRCDEFGRFEVHPVTAGPFSLSWSPDDPSQRPLFTTWVLL